MYVVENVPGMLKFKVVMEALTKLPDYYVRIECPVNANMWLPQERKRLILIGSKRPFNNFEYPEDSIKLYLDDSIQEDMDKEIFMDVNLKHYPLRDYKAMWSEMNSVVKDYAKLGKRNKQAIEHQKLGKHMMHLVRLYYMCFDILENEKIITYREEEHDLLMSIRGGKYLDSNNQPIPEFFEIVDALDKRLEYDKKNTSLPERPNYDKINEFVMSVNERVVKDKI